MRLRERLARNVGRILFLVLDHGTSWILRIFVLEITTSRKISSGLYIYGTSIAKSLGILRTPSFPTYTAHRSSLIILEMYKARACETFPKGILKPLTIRFKGITGIARLSSIVGTASEEMVSEVFDVPRISALLLGIRGQVIAGYSDKDLTYDTDKA